MNRWQCAARKIRASNGTGVSLRRWYVGVYRFMDRRFGCSDISNQRPLKDFARLNTDTKTVHAAQSYLVYFSISEREITL